MPQNSQEHTTKIREKCDHAPLRWRTFAARPGVGAHRVFEAPHAIDATITRMFNSL